MKRYCTIPKIFNFRKLFENKFGDLCKQHDIEYKYRRISRKESDYKMYIGMKQKGYPILAFLTYIILRSFGWIYYYF